MKKLILISFLVFVGCAHLSTVKSDIANQSFQSQNLPVRELSVAVISEESWSEEAIEKVIIKASDLMLNQVGIRLKVKDRKSSRISSFTPDEGVNSIERIVGQDHEKYDLVIGFSSRGIPSHLLELSTGYAWLGAIDDDRRKFIIIKHLDERILMHEICHAFVFSRDHSFNGVLTTWIVKVPLIPIIINLPKYLSKRDRQEVLKNKWRSFK